MVVKEYAMHHSYENPLVSLVVPSFNESADIVTQSLRSVIDQSFGDFECIVVDESTDPVCAAACKSICEQDKRFRYIYPASKLGLAESLNEGMRLAKGKYIARFDSDDICMPDRLAQQVEFLDANPDIGVLGGGLEIIDEPGNTLAFRYYPQRHDAIEKKFQSTTALAHPTVMFRRELVIDAGGYDASFRFSEDLDLWLRLLNRKVNFANLSTILVRYRQQNTQRNKLHWSHNLRARRNNFSSRYFFRRIGGIIAIVVWSRLPSSIQGNLFRSFLLRKNSHE